MREAAATSVRPGARGGDHRRVDEHHRLGIRDVVLFFTDGLPKASDADGVMFGERNIERALAKNAPPAVHIVANLLVEVRQHMADQKDDITLVARKRTNSSTPSGGALQCP